MRPDPLLFQDFNGRRIIYFADGTSSTIDELSSVSLHSPIPEFYRVKFIDFILAVDTPYFKSFNRPYLMFRNGFECPQMSLIRYSRDEIETLNEQGLHIFLNENLVKYSGARNGIVKNDIKDRILEFKPGINMGIYGDLRCSQFDSISDLIANNGLTKVHVYTIELGVSEVFGKRYSNMTFHWCDNYMPEAISTLFNESANSNPPSIKGRIDFKFINYNWRYEAHRELVAAYLVRLESKVSWYYHSDFNKMKNNLWFDIEKWRGTDAYSDIKDGIKLINTCGPYSIDKSIASSVQLTGTMKDMLLLPADSVPASIKNSEFDNVFCAVVGESVYAEPTSTASEKTLWAIYNMTPFIIVGTPGALEYIRRLGFKTFSDFWSEDYDTERDHAARMLKIFNLIDSIDALSYEELDRLYKKMLPTLEFNQQRLIEMSKNNLWLNND